MNTRLQNVLTMVSIGFSEVKVYLFVCIVAGEAYEEPRLTCWYGELPYTYARSTMAANTQVR